MEVKGRQLSLQASNGRLVLGRAPAAEGNAGFCQEVSRCITERHQRAKTQIEVIEHGVRQGEHIVPQVGKKRGPGAQSAYRGAGIRLLW